MLSIDWIMLNNFIGAISSEIFGVLGEQLNRYLRSHLDFRGILLVFGLNSPVLIVITDETLGKHLRLL
jgi:hypothetical protein